MKLKIAALLLTIPLGMTVIAKAATANEFNPASAIVAQVSDRTTQNRPQPPRQNEPRRTEARRVWIAAHWERTPRGRQWVPGHWETRR